MGIAAAAIITVPCKTLYRSGSRKFDPVFHAAVYADVGSSIRNRCRSPVQPLHCFRTERGNGLPYAGSRREAVEGLQIRQQWQQKLPQ